MTDVGTATKSPVFNADCRAAASRLITLALNEDLGDRGDITSAATIEPDAAGEVAVVSRESGVVAGLPIAAMVCEAVDPSLAVECGEDAAAVSPGDRVASLRGNVRSLLTAERTVLNFLTHLSGVASLSRRFADAVAGTRAVVLDTRKTLPGWRRLAKYAVACGGGANHRMGLHDMVLIKDNHIAAWRQRHGDAPLSDILRGVREAVPAGTPVMIEVDTLGQMRAALPGGPDFVLLDNMTNEQLAEAVAVRDAEAAGVLLEASGGVNLATVAGIAATGVDRISVGALTHSAPNFDLGFDWL